MFKFPKLIFMVLLVLLFVQCKTRSPIITSKNEISSLKNNTPKKEVAFEKEKSTVKSNDFNDSKINKSSNNNLKIDEIIKTANSFNGTIYKYGGTTAKGMDCSGLVFQSFLSNNIPLPRTSFEMSQKGFKVSPENYKIGDLIFFATNNQKRINHVGIITEVKNKFEIIFIHSTIKKGVIYSSTLEPYYQKSFVQVNRILID